MRVKELMSANVCFVTAEASFADAAALMKRYDIGMVPICDQKGCLLGVVTDRDLALHLLCEPSPEKENKISSIMTKDVAVISSSAEIHHAALSFSRHKVRRLPVLDNGRLVGILSLSDLATRKIFLAEVGEIMGSLAKTTPK